MNRQLLRYSRAKTLSYSSALVTARPLSALVVSNMSPAFAKPSLFGLQNINTNCSTKTNVSTEIRSLLTVFPKIQVPFMNIFAGLLRNRVDLPATSDKSLVDYFTGMLACSTMRKRKAKMNKHKLRKRRKKMRMNTKISRGWLYYRYSATERTITNTVYTIIVYLM
jgi:hypothetical protein